MQKFNNLTSKIKSWRNIVLTTLLLVVSSCDWVGTYVECIEADDFGEYKYETVRVYAKGGTANCDYNESLTIDELGPILSECLYRSYTAVDSTVYPGGCLDTTISASDGTACVNSCIAECNYLALSSGDEPYWEATDIDFIMEPNTEITIKATGTMSLETNTEYGPFKVYSDIKELHIKDSNGDDKPTMLIPGSTFIPEFKFNNLTDDDKTYSVNNLADIYNAATRLFAYLDNYTQRDSSDWSCHYTDLTCRDANWDSIGYNGSTSTNFNFDKLLLSSDFDPAAEGYINLGNISSSFTIPSSNDYYKIALKNNAPDSISSDCAGNLNISNIGDLTINGNWKEFYVKPGDIVSNSGNSEQFYYYDEGDGSYDGSNDFPVLITEPDTNVQSGQAVATIYGDNNLSSGSDNFTFTSNGSYNTSIELTSTGAEEFNLLNEGGSTTMAQFITDNISAIKSGDCNNSFYKYTLLPLNSFTVSQDTSGFLKFKQLNHKENEGDLSTGITNSCDFNLKILTKESTYEYSDRTSSDYNISVTGNSNGSENWTNEEIFVRNGQTILYDSYYYDDNDDLWKWQTNNYINNHFNCGFGVKVKFEPRPAIFCSGTETRTDIVSPSCNVVNGQCDSYNSLCLGTPCGSDQTIWDVYQDKSLWSSTTGRNETFNGCYDSSETFCMDYDTSCQDSTDCQQFSDADGNQIDDADTKCIECKNIRYSEITYQEINQDLCYNIDDYSDSLEVFLSLSDSDTNKSSHKIESFDTSFGNFSDFTESTSGGYYILDTSMNSSGNLKFLYIAGEALSSNNYFKNLDNQYQGNSGNYEIKISGNENFFNGGKLEAHLCFDAKDGDDNWEYRCSQNNITNSISDRIVDLENPSNSNYLFDSSGYLFTEGNNESIKEYYEFPKNIISTDPESNNYSKYQNLRLTFKINDDKRGNCTGSNGSWSDCTNSTTDANCNYVKFENPYYDDKTDSNKNVICHDSGAPTTDNNGNQCEAQYYCASKYADNSGYYDIRIQAPKNETDYMDIPTKIINPLIALMDGDKDNAGYVERVYKSIVADSNFQTIAKLIFTLAIVFYGIGYFMGVSEFTKSELIIRIFKVGLIYFFIGEGGWDAFNKYFVSFFKDGVDFLTFMMASSFSDSEDLTAAIANNDFSNKGILFSSVNDVLNMLVSGPVIQKTTSLLFASLFGWAYMYLIVMAFFIYIGAVANAILIYITAQIFISILFLIGPLFFLFLFFKQTQGMFDKWLTQLISFSLQQILLLTTLVFFNMMMYEVIKMALGFRICWDSVWVINIPFRLVLLSYWYPASLPPSIDDQSAAGDIGINTGIPSFFSILFIWVIAKLMAHFITFMVTIATAISGGISSATIASGVQGAASAAMKEVKASGAYKKTIEAANDAVSGAVREGMATIDNKLFDSGAKADKERTDSEKMRGAIPSMKEAGKNAVDKFKKTSEYNNMSKTEQKDKLKEVAEKAQRSKAESLGFDEKATNKIMKGKIPNNDRDLLGAAKNAINTINFDQENKNIDTGLTSSQLKDLKDNTATEDGKKKIDKKIENHEIQMKEQGTFEKRADEFERKARKAKAENRKMDQIGNLAGEKAAKTAQGAQEITEGVGRSILGSVGGVLGGVAGAFNGVYRGGSSAYNKHEGLTAIAATIAAGSLGLLRGGAAGAEAGAKLSSTKFKENMDDIAFDPLMRKSDNDLKAHSDERQERADFQQGLEGGERPKNQSKEDYAATEIGRLDAQEKMLLKSKTPENNETIESKIGLINEKRDKLIKKHPDLGQNISNKSEEAHLAAQSKDAAYRAKTAPPPVDKKLQDTITSSSSPTSTAKSASSSSSTSPATELSPDAKRDDEINDQTQALNDPNQDNDL